MDAVPWILVAIGLLVLVLGVVVWKRKKESRPTDYRFYLTTGIIWIFVCGCVACLLRIEDHQVSESAFLDNSLTCKSSSPGGLRSNPTVIARSPIANKRGHIDGRTQLRYLPKIGVKGISPPIFEFTCKP